MRLHGRIVLCCALTAVGYILITPTTVHSQARALGTDVLTRRSEIVAHGRVKEMKSQWEGNKERIVTRVTMAVGEYLKGGAGSVMTITSPGGEVDGVGEWYSHTARFAKDEEVVVFAEKDKKGNLQLTGGSEGKISIKKDASSGMSRVSDGVSLDDFKARIKETVRKQAIK
jgi:hypothetical protein